MGSSKVENESTLGWFAVLGTFCTWFAWIGMVKGMSVMLPTLQQQFDSQTWLVGWMIAILDGFIDLTGPLASPIQRRFGTRPVVLVSGLFVGASFIVSSLVSSLLGMTLALALFAAPGVGMANIVSRDLIGQCFTETHTRAFGIGASGASVAFIVFVPLVQWLLDLYGWRGAMMIQGPLLLHIAVCGAPMGPTKKPKLQKGDYKLISKDEICPGFGCRSILTSVKDQFQMDLFTSLDYWLVVLVTTFTTVSATAWYVFFPSNVNQAKDFSLADAASFVTVFGVGKIVGNLTAVLFDSVKAVSTTGWMTLAVIGSSACLVSDPFLSSYWPIMAYVFIYGLLHSCVYTLLDVLTKKFVGAEQLGSALGWIGLKAGIARALFVFFPGLVYDTYGNYNLAFILLAAINTLALPALLVLKWRHGNFSR